MKLMQGELFSVKCADRESWRSWLLEHHSSEKEVWLIYYKKHTGVESIIYREALEEALCFGWIDGMVKRIDEETYMQRFTPRRKKSNWSEVNKKLSLKLLKEGRMHAAGLVYRDEWLKPEADFRFSASSSAIPPELEARLEHHPEAKEFFMKLTISCQRQYIDWIMSGKREETRAKRIGEAISMLTDGKKLGLK